MDEQCCPSEEAQNHKLEKDQATDRPQTPTAHYTHNIPPPPRPE